ncbi:MAG: dienelactone hydrolase family protein [Chloroflexaceae bacterium]|nr:dienelactone hydrolase family protein [Chloroflexaceae bacterium]
MNARNRWILLLLLSVATALLAFNGHPFIVNAAAPVADLERVHFGDRPVSNLFSQAEPRQAVQTSEVQYATVNGKVITGYFAKPKTVTGPLPAVITIHEWWGLNDNIRAATRRLAGEGYQVLAVDLYGAQTAQTPEAARQLLQQVNDNPTPAKDNLRQAYQYLANRQKAPKVGVMGWCFGGAWSLQTALLLPTEIDATVIYYGRLVNDPAQLRTLQMPILGIFGANDQSIPVADVRRFEETLKSLGKTVTIQIYDNAGHAFANPSGDRYVPAAAEAAWSQTTDFLARTLKPKT